MLGLAQEAILSHRITKDGSLAVSVASLPAANKLLATTPLTVFELKPSTPKSYSENIGNIKGVSLQFTVNDLLEYLHDAGVTYVKRQVAYRRQEDGNSTPHPKHSVILSFIQDCPMPSRVRLGFRSHPVEEYFGAPIQCCQCQRFGDITENGRSTRRCKISAGPHHHKDCNYCSEPNCAYCGCSQAAAYAGCASKKANTVLRKQKILNGRAPYSQIATSESRDGTPA